MAAAKTVISPETEAKLEGFVENSVQIVADSIRQNTQDIITLTRVNKRTEEEQDKIIEQ